jgi:hypothetical protein
LSAALWHGPGPPPDVDAVDEGDSVVLDGEDEPATGVTAGADELDVAVGVSEPGAADGLPDEQPVTRIAPATSRPAALADERMGYPSGRLPEVSTGGVGDWSIRMTAKPVLTEYPSGIRPAGSASVAVPPTAPRPPDRAAPRHRAPDRAARRTAPPHGTPPAG